MAHNPEPILSLLPLLNEHIVDKLESETLNFKECPTEAKLRQLSKEMAVCLGNASGGTVVFGVKERTRGCDKAIVGVDFAPDLDSLNAALEILRREMKNIGSPGDLLTYDDSDLCGKLGILRENN